MLRLFQFLLVLVFVRILWGAIRMMLTRPQAASSGGSSRSGAVFQGEVVRCDRCGLHVPADRILHGENGSYCSGPCEPGKG